ncbi:magnesium transporter [Algiphilus sp.]|uniref:magnesium transporter n=1 Tax=Algiphilus sp. TaxID=1872431 RepID=UPI0025C3B148|nr:magnesium transporter [Algiphilus sp.]MCK5771768.1 magnesium transporter [Algiphilus sp.]
MNAEESSASVAELVRALHGRVPRDAASLLEDEPAEVVAAVLERLPPHLAREIAAHLPAAQRHAAAAPGPDTLPGSVGELMAPPDGVLPAHTTVAEAIAWLRAHADPWQITYLFVTDGDARRSGLVVIRDLLLADAGEPLSHIMLRDPFRLRVDQELDEALQEAVHRHYPIYPVVDAAGRLVGSVRGWQLFERREIAITAQPGRMVGVTVGERVTTPLLVAFRLRHPWLQLNLLTAFLAALVVGMFDDTIARLVALAAFLPVLAGQSGNNGSQTLAITLRGLTLGDIADVPLRRHLTKEVSLGAMNGLLTGLVAGAAMWWTAAQSGAPEPGLLALVICLAMTGACMASGFFGVAVPLLLRRLGTDPATASSIFLTTGTDIAGMGLMLALASWMVL